MSKDTRDWAIRLLGGDQQRMWQLVPASELRWEGMRYGTLMQENSLGIPPERYTYFGRKKLQERVGESVGQLVLDLEF